MEDNILTQLNAIPAGIFLVAVVYLVDKIIGWLKALKGDKQDAKCEQCKKYIQSINDKLTKLYDMHNVKDRDQVPVWYIRQSFIDAIVQTARELENINRRLELIDDQLNKLRED